MADDKPEDKGDDKPEDKGDDKPEDKGGVGGLLSPANGTGGGWVVVSFIGPAGLDIRRLAATILFGRGGVSSTRALGNAAAAALKESRKRAADQERLVKAVKKAAVQPKALPAPKTLVVPETLVLRPKRGARRSRPRA